MAFGLSLETAEELHCQQLRSCAHFVYHVLSLNVLHLTFRKKDVFEEKRLD